jgi:hypothetical protein
MRGIIRAEILPDLKRVCSSPSFLDIADFTTPVAHEPAQGRRNCCPIGSRSLR